MQRATAQRRPREVLRGLPASPGVAIGEAHVLLWGSPEVPRQTLTRKEVEREIRRFQRTLAATRSQLQRSKRRLHRHAGETAARIIDSHILLLEDAVIVDRTVRRIREDLVNAEYAFQQTMGEVIQGLESASDPYLRERSADLLDVQRRVLASLQGRVESSLEEVGGRRVVLVAHDLSPTIAVGLNRNSVVAFLTDASGPTSHAAILARSLEIPAVVGLKEITRRCASGDRVIVDGMAGTVVIAPTAEDIAEHQEKVRRRRELEEELALLRDLPAITVDGYRVELSANLDLPEEVDSALHHGAQGVGLFRTEYLFLGRRGLPSEDEQYQAYRHVVERMAPGPVIIRAIDLGGDKPCAALGPCEERNPVLGWRAIRLALSRRDVFATQLRAILRATAHGNVKVMFPMVSSLEELGELWALLDEVEADLKRQGIPFEEDYERGIMIETPAAAITTDLLASRVQFVSIGTNDLIQYTLAVDRGNERVAPLYQPLHPAVLRLIKACVDGAKAGGIWVGVCGEMAASPLMASLLIGLGVDELSTSPILLPEIKRLVRSVSIAEARQVAQEALGRTTAGEVERLLRERLGERFAEFPFA